MVKENLFEKSIKIYVNSYLCYRSTTNNNSFFDNRYKISEYTLKIFLLFAAGKKLK